MKVQTNLGKYVNTRFDMHVSDGSRKAIQKDEEYVERQNRMKEVCLNCTKKKCSGTDRCFKNERNNGND